MTTLEQMLIADDRALTIKAILDITEKWLQQKQEIKLWFEEGEEISRKATIQWLLEELKQQ